MSVKRVSGDKRKAKHLARLIWSLTIVAVVVLLAAVYLSSALLLICGLVIGSLAWPLMVWHLRVIGRVHRNV